MHKSKAKIVHQSWYHTFKPSKSQKYLVISYFSLIFISFERIPAIFTKWYFLHTRGVEFKTLSHLWTSHIQVTKSKYGINIKRWLHNKYDMYFKDKKVKQIVFKLESVEMWVFGIYFLVFSSHLYKLLLLTHTRNGIYNPQPSLNATNSNYKIN